MVGNWFGALELKRSDGCCAAAQDAGVVAKQVGQQEVDGVFSRAAVVGEFDAGDIHDAGSVPCDDMLARSRVSAHRLGGPGQRSDTGIRADDIRAGEVLIRKIKGRRLQ